MAVIDAFDGASRYQGSGSSRVNPTRRTTVQGALAANNIVITAFSGNDSERAAQVAGSADVALLLVGLPDAYESEGFDRDRLDLPAEHVALIEAVCRAQPRTVMVLLNGAPVSTPWRARPATILESYLGGQASGGAIVDVLLGDAEPGGRLAETFPEAVEDVAANDYFPGRPRQVEHREGLAVGYRQHTSTGVSPAFPFGHGLTYTTFDWSRITLSSNTIQAGKGVQVRLVVTNIGDRAGSDVVQVYRHDRTGVVLRPRRELVGFAKVHLRAGESREVQVDVQGRGFAFWDVPTSDWQVPSGSHDLEVGRSSEDIVAALPLTVAGCASTAAEPPGGPLIAADDSVFAHRLGYPIPTPAPARPFTRDSTLEELATNPVGRVIRAALLRASPTDQEGRKDQATMLMIERSINELPLRAAARFSEGKLSWDRVDLLLDALNGRVVGVARRVLRAVGPSRPR